MAHAVPAHGTPTGTAGRARTTPGRAPRRTPDVFGARTHLVAKWAGPLLIGLVYGYWAASIRRDGGPITGWNLFFGFMAALAFAALYVVVRAVAERLPREGHAVLWGAFAGCALGFLYSGSGVAMFTSILVSLLLAAAVASALFYRYYTRENGPETGTGTTA